MLSDPDRRNNILIVDDSPENLTVLRKMLTEHGYRIRPAISGEIALKAIQSDPPDLILLDILMPQMDGFEVCKRIKSDSRTCDIPIIFISALSELDNVIRAFKKGGVDYIAKPFQSEEVLARVRTHIDLQNAIRQKDASHLMLQTILDSIENTIVTVDADLNILNSNRSLDTLCGYCESGQSFPEIIANRSGPCAEVLLQTLKSNKPVKEYRVTCRRDDGERTFVLNTAPLNPQKNGLNGAVLVIRDISRITELEKKILDRHSYHNIIGQNETMLEVYRLLERISDLDVNILICGESGTGKELVADAIHYGSCRAAGPLIKVNCAALSENLLESELFGHIRGAFTGAVRDRIGRCEAAEGGTLFLDEIGDISPRFQAKLLRFLEHKEYERIGDSKTLQADVRLVAATNQDLVAKVRDKSFREDLFYRLKGVVITLPPLKERADDILLLTNHFINLFREQLGNNIEAVSDEVQRILVEYPWPGNIRELKSAVYHACALCSGEIIQLNDLPQDLLASGSSPSRLQQAEHSILHPAPSRSERETIVACLDKTDWNKAKTARLLGISRATLYNKLAKYDITADIF